MQDIDLGPYLSSGGQFLKAADLPERGVEVTISAVEADEYQGDRKIVLSFEGKQKKLSLNATNLKRMVELCGGSTSAWVGKLIVIYKDVNVNNPQGERVGGVRIRPPYEPGLDDDLSDF